MTVTIDNIPYYYRDEGEGEVVLLIHGNPDSADYWDGLMRHLVPTFRCIAPDLPGFGRSDIPDQLDFSLDYAHAWLQSFIEAIHLKKTVHLVVHDIGAFFGLSWATIHPQQVKSICVTNTLYFSDYRWHFWGRVWRTPILGELSGYFTSKWLYTTNLKKASPKLTEAFLEKGWDLFSANPKMHATILKVYRAMSPSVFKGWEDRYLELTKTKPTIVIWGDQDPYIPLKFGYAERMANGQTLHRIADAGHWVAAEIPELFALYWLEFAKGVAVERS